MINIKFSYTENGDSFIYSLNGHAEAGDVGKDIICASASMLTYTLGQCIKDMYERGQLKKKPKIDLKEGEATIVAKPKKDNYAECLHVYFVIQTGLAVLSYNYPQFVSLEMFQGEEAL